MFCSAFSGLTTVCVTATNSLFGFNQSKQLQKRKRVVKNKFDTLIDTMTAISNKKIDTFVKGIEDDVAPDLRHFFSSLSRTVSKFDEYNRALVKKRIMDIVMDMDIYRLQQRRRQQPQHIQNNHNSNWSSSYTNQTHTNTQFSNISGEPHTNIAYANPTYSNENHNPSYTNL